MAIVTLTTSWVDDYYIAVLKGAILSKAPDVRIIDLSHRVPPFKTGIAYAAFMVQHCYTFFPAGSIHLISVSSEYSEETPFIAAFHDGQYFIGTDNGLFSLVFRASTPEMVRIERFTDEAAPNYPAISVFAPTAAYLACGGKLTDLGHPYEQCLRKGMMMAAIDDASISGTIIRIDVFGNAITNITREDFEMAGKGRAFEIFFQRMKYKITRLNKYYNETIDGELLALFDDLSGLLLVAIANNNAAHLFGLKVGDPVMVKFLGDAKR